MSLLANANAVAALGTLCKIDNTSPAEMRLAPNREQDVRQAEAHGSVDLNLDLTALAELAISEEGIEDLQRVWESAAVEYERNHPYQKLRLRVETGTLEQAPEIVKIIRKADNAGAVTIVARDLVGPLRWDLPLNIGAYGAEARSAIESYWHAQLIEFDFIDTARHNFDLLIFESLAEVERVRDKRLTAGFLVVQVETPDDLSVATVRRLNEAIGFRAAALIQRPDSFTTCIQIFLDNLAHNNQPDIAITQAGVHDAPLLIVGDPAFLDRARISTVTAHLEDELERQFHSGAIETDEFSDMVDEVAAAPGPDSEAWDAESGAATETVHRTARIGALLVSRAGTLREATMVRPQRHLQAQVFDVSGGAPVQRMRSFEAGADHEINVRIGPTSMNWINAPRGFPDHALPEQETRLTVTLLAPAFVSTPVAQEILIGPTGSSEVAKFSGSVPADAIEIDATIIVYHKGNHLQTAQLSGPVTHGENVPEATGIDFSLGLPSEAELGRQRPFDLSIWKDETELELTIFDANAAPGQPSNTILHPELGGIDAVVAAIREELFDAARRIEQLETGIENAGLRTLNNLAAQGEYLRRILFGTTSQEHIRRVQVTSPHSSDFFPVEYLYDYVLPDETAALCPEFKRSDGPDCSPNCPAAAGDSRFVCPSGLWALNRVIERQVRPHKRAGSRQPEVAAHQQTRLGLNGIIFAASNEVNTPEHPNETADTIVTMQAAAPVYPANTWQEWVDHVRDHYPSLLVALPHNVESRPFHKLQIAASEELALNRITMEHVRPGTDTLGSAVLLLGCNTANATVAYQDFVNELRCAGASLVIATLTYVLGPQAAKVAREFVAQIWRSRDSDTVGEIMRQVRGRMLAQDNIMALAITAFGDADWRFYTERQ
ncbi:MAG: hypothetical protein KQH59_19200 [Desulfobulbaceae bacterium]|nr:hypothetical protein [Desulfobulbaceae bacterium]